MYDVPRLIDHQQLLEISLEYRQLGKCDLKVSVIGFGAAPLGDVYGRTDPAVGRYAVHLAIDQGINFFDVSPYYGLTLAESRLGDALRGRRDQVILATKCGRHGVDHFDFSAARIRTGIDESLARLKTDHVDLLQAHDIEFGNLDQIITETIPAMRELQREGKARYIGITGYPLPALLRVAEAAPVDTILSYCRYNLMITDMDNSLTSFAKEHGIGLINASGLAMGLLTKSGPPDWHPAPSEVRQAARRVTDLCRLRGVDVSTLALRFCLDHPYVSSTLIGVSTPDEVRNNLAVLGSAADKDLVHEIREALGPFVNYVWPSGRRENQV